MIFNSTSEKLQRDIESALESVSFHVKHIFHLFFFGVANIFEKTFLIIASFDVSLFERTVIFFSSNPNKYYLILMQEALLDLVNAEPYTYILMIYD